MKKIKGLSITLLFILTVLALSACGDSEASKDSSEGNESTEESNESSDESQESITISGSSAMQPLVAAAAEKYMEEFDGDIIVNAGGSGTGLSEVSEGTVNIGNSDVFAEAKDGIPADELVDHQVAVVGMTAAVNQEVGVTNLSKEDLIKVFTGEITNWADVGGADQEIVLVNRPDSSGTRDTFVNYALDGATPAEGITEDSSNTVRKIVQETPGAVGYLALSYFSDDAVIPLAVDDVEATDENIQSGDFPIWAYQHSYTKGEPTDLESSFLEYMMSDEIQTTLLADQGYVAATKMEVERDAKGNQTAK